MKIHARSHFRRTRRRGFTLMEVLLVLAILVILGSLVGFAFTRMQKQSFSGAAKTQIDSFKTSLQNFHLHMGRYPDKLEDLRLRPSGDASQRWQGPYIDSDVPADPWGRPYQYETATDEFGDQIFVITSLGPDGQPGTEDDVTNRPKK